MFCRRRIFSPTRNRIFLITYLSYTVLYATRKPFSVVKGSIKESLNLTTTNLGTIDTAFLGSYAISQLVSPWIFQRSGLPTNRLLLILYVFAGIANVLFALAAAPTLLAFFWVINGIVHAGVFPLLIRILSPQFPSSQRGRVMGAWTTSQQVVIENTRAYYASTCVSRLNCSVND